MHKKKLVVKKFHLFILAIIILATTACQLKLKQQGTDGQAATVEVKRYDRLESRYLTTGDFSALQQMNTDYPKETRTLIEDVLQIGEANDPEINSKLLKFYQDTTLQTIIADAEQQYANMNDVNSQLTTAMKRLKKMRPDIQTPSVYAQIGALGQSIIIGNGSIGISLDKYLGKDYPPYLRYYTPQQRQQMTRESIVPDCMSFYLLSLYPLKDYNRRTQYERDRHMGKIMWAVNRLLDRKAFSTKFTAIVDRYAKMNPKMSVRDILESDEI